jgi:hypothetical protein
MRYSVQIEVAHDHADSLRAIFEQIAQQCAVVPLGTRLEQHAGLRAVDVWAVKP